MLNRLTSIIAFVLLALAVSPAWADEFSNTIAIFQNAGERQVLRNRVWLRRLPDDREGSLHRRGRAW